MTRQVYTLGYSGRQLDEIKAMVEEREAILFDIRFSPRSRNPTWNEGNLRAAFGARYRHIRALGNANYRGHSIRIQDFDDQAFSRIIHDPPMFSLAGDLYSSAFYEQVYRVLRPSGRLFHYIGDPKSRSGRNVTRGVVRRLHDTGFKRVKPYAQAYGVVAYK